MGAASELNRPSTWRKWRASAEWTWSTSTSMRMLAADLRARYGTARVVTTTNTFNPHRRPARVHGGRQRAARSSGQFTVEVPQLRDLIENNEFDTIYHDTLRVHREVTSRSIWQASTSLWRLSSGCRSMADDAVLAAAGAQRILPRPGSGRPMRSALVC